MSQEHLPSTTLAQLDRLLPLDLAAAIQTQHPPPPEALTRALALLRARLDAILPLVPPPIAHQHLRDPSPGAIRCQRLYGSLLFADLSGFTALSEQLAALGREGSEVVTEVINRLFAALTGEVHRYGGALLKFGGDALTALFDQAELGEDHAALALAAAQGMQQQMAAIGLVETRGGRHQLRLRTGVHSGTLIAAQLGDNEHMELLLTGHAVHQVARAQEVALPGEVVLSTAALAHIAGAQVTPRDEDFAVLLAFDSPAPRAAPRLPLPKQSGDLAEISALVEAISALELFLPQGLAHTGIVADERLASGFRLVTVLFAHVAPLSTLLEQLPPDLDAAPLLNAYYRRMQQVVQRFGGSINKLDLAADGDKLLACFGAPLAQEQHHELAVRAALAMQAALAEANAEIAALGLDLPPLQQRLGLNTGHVFAGLVGTPARREYTVMGDVVNLAARLMAYAPPGAIWISPVTQRAVAHCIQCQALPALQLKGKAAPVTPYAVITAYEAERPRETGLVGRAPLVGRQAELALLQEAATTALQGGGANGGPHRGGGRRQEPDDRGAAELAEFAESDGWQRAGVYAADHRVPVVRAGRGVQLATRPAAAAAAVARLDADQQRADSGAGTAPGQGAGPGAGALHSAAWGGIGPAYPRNDSDSLTQTGAATRPHTRSGGGVAGGGSAPAAPGGCLG